MKLKVNVMQIDAVLNEEVSRNIGIGNEMNSGFQTAQKIVCQPIHCNERKRILLHDFFFQASQPTRRNLYARLVPSLLMQEITDSNHQVQNQHWQEPLEQQSTI